VILLVGPLADISQFSGLPHDRCRTETDRMWWR
jgi:hypothetical protein